MCGKGYYSDASTSYECTVCPVGYYCPNAWTKTQCDWNKVCYQGSINQNTACPAWLKCDVGHYYTCPDGQYMYNDRSSCGANCCQACPAGQTCEDRTEGGIANIDSGYYSHSGMSVQLLCPAGYSCDNTNNPVECNSGWYSVESDLGCTECDVNWACPNKELTQSDQIDCRLQRGMWQDASGQTECKIAAAGTYIEIGDTSPTTCPSGSYSYGAATGCIECPPGFACPSTTAPTRNKCLRGHYADSFSQNTCTVCPAGYMCEGE
jgi:hypothetical protein